MIVADILMWFLLIAGTYIVINGYWLSTQGLFPALLRCSGSASVVPRFKAAAVWLARQRECQP